MAIWTTQISYKKTLILCTNGTWTGTSHLIYLYVHISASDPRYKQLTTLVYLLLLQQLLTVTRYLGFLRPLMGASLSIYHCQVLQITWRTFSNHNSINSKKQLYISLVCSQLLYCSVLWKPHPIKHIQLFEQVQWHATKHVLNDFTSDYKSRLINKLQLLPLMYIFDLSDIMLFIKSYKTPHAAFDITNHVSLATGNTRLSIHHKLNQTRSSDNTTKNFYFNRLPRLWNYLPVINTELNLSTIKYKLRNYLYMESLHN